MRKAALRRSLVDLLREGEVDVGIYHNANLLFAMLVRIRREGFDIISREDVSPMLSDKELMKQLWATVTSRTIQYRMQSGLLERRQFLIENGVPEEVLPLTEELQARSQTLETRDT